MYIITYEKESIFPHCFESNIFTCAYQIKAPYLKCSMHLKIG